MKYYFLIALLVLPAVISLFDNGNKYLAKAEDPIDEDEVDVEGETDDGAEIISTDNIPTTEDESKSSASQDIETILLFTKPNNQGASQLELVAGAPVEFLVGFHNKGKDKFVVDSLDTSFRYPLDFNFIIQNFSAIGYNKAVQPDEDATLYYRFIPGDGFAGRPFGLHINLIYHDSVGNYYQESMFNETVQVVELDEGFDGETFFLYVFLAAGVVLLLVIGQQTLLSVGKKRITKKVAPVETGTSNPNNVDYDWLPAQTLASLKKGEKLQKSPKSAKSQQSPRQRKRGKTEN